MPHVIPDTVRNPVVRDWIPFYAGMTMYFHIEPFGSLWGKWDGLLTIFQEKCLMQVRLSCIILKSDSLQEALSEPLKKRSFRR
ncbi:MAG: hypothetical protein AUK25_06075 [Desulfobacteraceae bacterium CG2_30_51_40]|nr:MAG: hypothetical protein AUK25_06075 [Desulfobacteraceae bacterium CG2_30_51_40]